MIAQIDGTQLIQQDEPRLIASRYVTAVFLAVVLSGIMVLLAPGLSAFQFGAVALLMLAIGFVAVALFIRRFYGRSHWGMVMFGQVLGCTAVALLFIAAL